MNIKPWHKYLFSDIDDDNEDGRFDTKRGRYIE